MSGIGPVGYFDLYQRAEVVSLVNVNITANTITSTLLRNVIQAARGASTFGYGAIGMPDVENLIIRDNTITDYGVRPGAEVCGIFVLHGQSVEISRNQIRETRDLSHNRGIGIVVVRGQEPANVTGGNYVSGTSASGGNYVSGTSSAGGNYVSGTSSAGGNYVSGTSSAGSGNVSAASATGANYVDATNATGAKDFDSYGGVRAGIYINVATPPTVDQSSGSAFAASGDSESTYEYKISEYSAQVSYAPGIPALRIQENQVRVALGLALSARGTGPFTIVNNQFSTGGTVRLNAGLKDKYDFAKPDTSIVGTDLGALTVSVLNMGRPIDAAAQTDSFTGAYESVGKETEWSNNSRVESEGGEVLFTNNLCLLDATRSRARGSCSVSILSLDHVLFANNQLRVDGPREVAMLDALLFGTTLHATANRLQEAVGYAVLYSGMTAGKFNITSQNISSYCLRVIGAIGRKVDAENLVLNSTLCRKGKREIAVQRVKTDQTAKTEVKGK